MKKILFALSLLWSCSARAAYPTFLSFNTNDFIVSQPYISLSRTNTGGTNVFNYTTNVYENSTIIYTNSTIIYTNSTITFNGTNLATINPTIGRVPYNFDGTNFYDTALYFIDTNTVGADQVFTYDLGVTNLAAGGFVVSIPTVGGYGVLTNAPFGSFALWTNINHVYIPTDSSQIGLIANNVDSIQTLIAGGALMFSSYGTPQLALGVNDLSNEFLGYMLLYSTTATPTDTQIRLSTGNGPGQLLILQNATNNAFELLNGDTLWDDATSAVYLPGGDWKPTAKGESIMLLHNTQGWAEIGRFGGSTNVVTQDLWQFAGGYLQPKDLTQPLFWTNSVTWGATTNLVLSRGTDGLVLHDYAGTTTLELLNQFGNGLKVTVNGDTPGLRTSGTSQGIDLTESGGNVLRWNLNGLKPSQTNTTLGGSIGDVGDYPLGNVNIAGTNYLIGFQNGGANYSRGANYHAGTNGAWVWDSQAAGTAGLPVKYDWDFGGTNVLRLSMSNGLELSPAPSGQSLLSVLSPQTAIYARADNGIFRMVEVATGLQLFDFEPRNTNAPAMMINPSKPYSIVMAIETNDTQIATITSTGALTTGKDTNRWIFKGVTVGATTNMTINVNGKDYTFQAW